MLTSTRILNNWEDGIHYCGDVDDLIDSLYDENESWYEFEEVLDKHLPELSDDLKDDILCGLMEKLVAMENS